MGTTILRFWAHQKGTTAIEYGLIAALISVAIIGALGATGSETGNIYSYIEDSIIPALNGAGN